MVDDDDDYTLADAFRDRREAARDKRAANRDDSAALLRERGAAFESRNGGAHLIVTHEERTVDFWPGTGLYVIRDGSGRGRGVFNLLRALRVAFPKGRDRHVPHH